MCEIFKYIGWALVFIVNFCIVFFFTMEIIEGIRNDLACRKIKKNPKARTDYPYLPLTMVTKHFGWSYEYEKYHGWNYLIWLVRDEGTKICVNPYNCGSRTQAIEDCRKLEEHFYGVGG